MRQALWTMFLGLWAAVMLLAGCYCLSSSNYGSLPGVFVGCCVHLLTVDLNLDGKLFFWRTRRGG